MRIQEWQGILVFAEVHQGNIADVTLELLGEGRKLAKELNCQVMAVSVDAAENDVLLGYGADIVYALSVEGDKQIDEIRYTDVICRLIEEIHPEIFLIGATMLGKSIAPRIAARLETGLTADCIELRIDKSTRNLLQIRPALQDSLLATIACVDQRPQITTVRENIFKADLFDNKRDGRVIAKRYVLDKDNRLEIMKQTGDDDNRSKRSVNKVIFGVGKGIGSKKNVEMVKRVAKKYGARVGATRSVVNEGWIEKEYQIGQTGITVSPRIYIACGISGAIQHLCGIQRAECIIAINTDENAPIFKVADVGIKKDTMDVLKYLLEN